MAIDFPSSPTVGQIFTAANGTSWQWNGTVWVAAGTATGLITGAPNKLINPFMEIDQANEGAAVTLTNATAKYVVDGWEVAFSNSTLGLSGQRIADAPPGYSNSLRAQVTTASSGLAATDYCQLYQLLEAEELIDTAFGTTNAKSLSIAFWVKASVTGTYSAVLLNNGQTRAYAFTFTVSTASTWQLVQQTIPGDTAGTWVISGNSYGLILLISLGVGSGKTIAPGSWISGAGNGAVGTLSNFVTTLNATFQLGPCGLWVAPAAQPLLRTSFQAELARCQRYYEKSYAPGTAVGSTYTLSTGSVVFVGHPADSIGGAYSFKVTKRAIPTLTLYSSNGSSGTIDYYNAAWAAGGTGASQTAYATGLRAQYAFSNTSAIAFEYVADARL